MPNLNDYHAINKPDRRTGRLGRYALVVRPDGIISNVPVNLSPEEGSARGGVVNETVQRDGSVRLTLEPFYADQGWSFLEALYAQDDDPELKAKGYKVYRDWNDAGRRGKVEQLDEAWLPSEVRERRARVAEAKTKGVFTPPKKGASDDTPKRGRR